MLYSVDITVNIFHV